MYQEEEPQGNEASDLKTKDAAESQEWLLASLGLPATSLE